jgi:hypothetical protein
MWNMNIQSKSQKIILAVGSIAITVFALQMSDANSVLAAKRNNGRDSGRDRATERPVVQLNSTVTSVTSLELTSIVPGLGVVPDATTSATTTTTPTEPQPATSTTSSTNSTASSTPANDSTNDSTMTPSLVPPLVPPPSTITPSPTAHPTPKTPAAATPAPAPAPAPASASASASAPAAPKNYMPSSSSASLPSPVAGTPGAPNSGGPIGTNFYASNNLSPMTTKLLLGYAALSIIIGMLLANRSFQRIFKS